MTTRTHVAKPQGDSIYVYPVEQTDEQSHKPRGFWYEVDGDWQRWCQDEFWGLDGDEKIYTVELTGVNLLTIRTVEELVAFTDQWKAEEDINWDSFIWKINWTGVAEIWDGIEIAPYQWEARLDHYTSWYYTWDCASGVIWEPRQMTVTA